MDKFLFLVHILGAAAVGFFLLLPFLLSAVRKLSAPQAAGGLITGLVRGNRISMYILIVQLLTGGYLMSKGDYSGLWMALVTVFWLLLIAFSGMIAGPMKRSAEALKNGGQAQSDLGKASSFSWILFVSLVVVLVLMVYNNI